MQRKYCAVCAIVTAAALICLAALGKQRKDPVHHGEIHLTDAQMCETWLNLYGWEVTPLSQSSTRMPCEYQTEIGQAWLVMQGKQGLSPLDFGGKDAVRYVYRVENMREDTFCAELLLCDDILAGAMVYDAQSGKIQPVR